MDTKTNESVRQRNNVLQDMRIVYEGASHTLVRVNKRKLKKFARELASQELKVPDWRFSVFPETDDDTFVRHLLVGNAINFCFTDPETGGRFAVEWSGEEWEGAMGMWAALMRAREEGFDIYNGDNLWYITEKQAEHIFRSSEAPLTLLQDRVTNLRDVAWLLQACDAEPANLVDVFWNKTFVFTPDEDPKCLDYSAVVPTLQWYCGKAYGKDHAYSDVFRVSTYGPLRFEKRARLFAIMYEGRARSSGGALPTLTNLDAIGPVIDYRIPQLLRHKGVLEYCPEIARKVDAGEKIDIYSKEELAIRVGAYVAVEDINRLVNEARQSAGKEPITMVELDYLLWSQGRKAEGKHHLTLTTAY